jgi:hypothetical protein
MREKQKTLVEEEILWLMVAMSFKEKRNVSYSKYSVSFVLVFKARIHIFYQLILI